MFMPKLGLVPFFEAALGGVFSAAWAASFTRSQALVSVLRATAKRLDAPRYEVAAALEQAALAELRQRRPDRAIETNVEFWAAVILDFAEVPPAMMPAMFTCGRTAGWCAHILEQKRLGKLVRPAAVYVGPGPRSASSVPGWDTIPHTT